MSTTHDPTTPPATAPVDDPDQLRLQIEQNREELGETVAALSEKADVKAQASAKAEELKEQASAKAEELKTKVHEVEETAKAKAQQNPAPFAIGALVLLVLLNRFRKRRKGRRIERNLMEDALQRTLAGGMPVTAVMVDRNQVAPAA